MAVLTSTNPLFLLHNCICNILNRAPYEMLLTKGPSAVPATMGTSNEYQRRQFGDLLVGDEVVSQDI